MPRRTSWAGREHLVAVESGNHLPLQRMSQQELLVSVQLHTSKPVSHHSSSQLGSEARCSLLQSNHSLAAQPNLLAVEGVLESDGSEFRRKGFGALAKSTMSSGWMVCAVWLKVSVALQAPVQSGPAMQGAHRQCGPGALAVVGVWPWLQAG